MSETKREILLGANKIIIIADLMQFHAYFVGIDIITQAVVSSQQFKVHSDTKVIRKQTNKQTNVKRSIIYGKHFVNENGNTRLWRLVLSPREAFSAKVLMCVYVYLP